MKTFSQTPAYVTLTEISYPDTFKKYIYIAVSVFVLFSSKYFGV